MTVLVTGGAGYIGSHTVRWLTAAGREVVVLDNLEHGFAAAVIDAPLVVGDIGDADLVAKVVAEYGVTAAIHFAAYKAAGESVEVPGKYFANNVGATARLLGALGPAGVGHVVFSSTCAVYGTPRTLPVDEAHPTGPESPYGESKLTVERMLPWFEAAHGLRSVSLRYFNAAGASADSRIGEDPRSSLNLVPVAMRAALGGDGLQVFGTDYPTADGTAIRDYVHVDDLADAHHRALEYLEAGGASTTLNLGTGTGSSVLDVIAATKRVSGVDFRVDFAPRRAGDPVAVYADNRRATAVLGWSPRFDLDAIVTTAWRWHHSHPHGYGGVGDDRVGGSD